MKKVTLLLIISIITLTPVFAETMTLDITKALDLLQENNMNIQATEFNLTIAKRNKDNAWNALLPSFDVTASTTLMDNPYYSSLGGTNNAAFNFNLGISATLGINYALGAAIKNYTLLYESGEISYEKAVKGMEKNTKIQFYSLLYMEEQIKISQMEIDLAEKRYGQAQENFKNGLIPQLDVLQTQVAYEIKKPINSNMQTQYDNMLMGFKVMLGIDRKMDIELDGTLDTETYAFEVEELISKYMARSLDLRSMNKNLDLLENSKKMNTQYAYTPLLSLSYTLSPLSYNPWGQDYPSIETWNFDEDSGIGMGTFYIGLTFSLDNFIPGSGTDVNLKNAKDEISQLKLSLQQSILDSEVEIINTIAKLENSIEQLEANKLNRELARKAYEMTSEAYQLGTKELLDVESAQNDLISAEVTVLGEQFTYISGLLNLEYTLNTSIEEMIK